VQWDLNGIAEARAIESGGTELLSPNHMLYRPIGFVIYEVARLSGYRGRSVEILQYVTAILASLGVGLFFMAANQLTGNLVAATVSTVFLVASWSYWTFSTDAYYITPAAAAVAGALAILLWRPKLSVLSSVIAGLVGALAVLFWQANVFLVPSLLVGILWTQRTSTLQSRLMLASVFLVSLGATVGVSYGLGATLAHGHFAFGELVRWASSHSSQGQVPLWGKWSIDRIPAAASSAVAAFVPVWEGVGLRSLMKGVLDWGKVLPQLSLVALVLLCVWSAIKLVRRRARSGDIVWLGLSYLAYVPFIVWWDPCEPKWFVVPSVFLVVLLAEIWSRDTKPKQYIVLGMCIAVRRYNQKLWIGEGE